jgi:hypothetical protein
MTGRGGSIRVLPAVMPTVTWSPDSSAAPASSLLALGDARERVISELSDAFARERIELDVFEHRLTLAHRARSLDELERLVVDLDPSLTQPLAREPCATALVPARAARPAVRADEMLPAVRSEETLLAFLGGLQRRGTWSVPRHLRVVACMGGVELDFREAQLAPGITDVTAWAAMGGVQIVVPPQLAVEVGGVAILGGFDQGRRLPATTEVLDPARPRLRVSGVALMGGVSVETRLPGESPRQARRRRRRERRHLRRGCGRRAWVSDGE